MASHTIKINIEEGGDCTYCPSTLNARTGDTVSWTSSTVPFAISFLSTTPFTSVTFKSQPDNCGGHLVAGPEIRPNALGHNLYAVALAQLSPCSDGTVSATVFLDAGCPDLVVSDQ